MSFIPLNLNDAVEAKPVPAGRYDLVISTCEEALTKEQQKPQFKLQINIEGHDEAPPVFHYVGIPTLEDEPSKTQFKALLLKRFLRLFKINFSNEGFDTEALAMEMIGARANAELQLQEYNGNVSNTLIVPRLKDEEGPAGIGRGSPPKRKVAA